MSKRYKLISVAVGFTLFIGLLIVLSNQPVKTAKPDVEADQGKEEEAAAVTVENLLPSTDDFKEIRITNENGELMLKQDASGNWNGIDLDREQDNNKVNNAIVGIFSLQGIKASSISREDTGLDESKTTIELLGESGTTVTTISIGKISEDEKFKYVALSDKKDAIYQVPVALLQPIPTRSHDLTDNSITTIKSESVNKITINNGMETIELLPSSPYEEEEVRTNLSGWFMHQPYKGVYSVQYNKLENILLGVNELELEEIMVEGVDDLQSYGLDDVNFTISLQSDSDQDTILIGSPAGGNTYYAKMKDDDKVFTISKKLLEPYSYQAFDIVDHFVKIISLDVLSEIKVKTNDNETVMKIAKNLADHAVNSKEKGMTFKVDGHVMEDKKFRDLYKRIAGLSATDVVTNAEYDHPEVSITYTIQLASDETKEILVEFVSYDEENYVAFVGDTAELLVDKQQVKDMINEINKVKKDE
ncbi:DUF4340 domain-containing protein [Aquibacillus kalidii]|uniref:DUF4340 domain-containing protein n=1 Tax=Aquibacillus kalidii TaxID=2762597 RepID=UPI001645D9CB|nr:DUF4340 domain-containing protein [Aquibacillus kalidii]